MTDKKMQHSKREVAEGKVKTARANLLLMIILSAVNIVLFLLGSDSMMLFSATIPYFAVVFGFLSEMSSALIVSICFAVVILVLYLLCWIFSKKHYAWMIGALVMFIIDSLAMVGLYILAEDVSGIIDVLIHIWVLYYLVIGVINGYRLKKMPTEPQSEIVPTETVQDVYTEDAQMFYNSAPLRRADDEVKHRVLIEGNYLGRHICYRRVKRVNELVIDNYVYADVEMLIEAAHSLEAKVDGHTIQAGFDGAMHSYLRIDGDTVAKKLRLY